MAPVAPLNSDPHAPKPMEIPSLRCVLAAALSLLALPAFAADERREMRWEFPGRDVAAMGITARAGTIRYFADRRDRVEIRAIRTVKARRRELARALAEDAPVALTLDDRQVSITDKWPSMAGDEKEPPEIRVDIEVHAPPGVALRTEIESGETRVEGETSVLTVRAGSGPVRLIKQVVRRGALVAVGSGTVEIDGRMGDLAVTVGNGSVRAERLDCGGAESVVIESQTGEVRAGFRSLPRTELRIQAGTGNVFLRLPGACRATATVITANGKANSEFALPRAARTAGDTGAYLAGTIGGGGVSVRVQTGSGNATLERG